MTMSSRTLLAAAAMIVVVGASPRVWADRNEVRAVSFSEDAGVTQVHVRGAHTPTFTVYKLERPSRVVIDLPQAKLADVLKGHESNATVEANTWAVSTIAAQQLDDGAVRVIVTLARPGRYDVKTDGNDVVVMVMPRDAAPKTVNPADLARMQQENDAAAATAKQSRAEADAAKQEAERLRKVAAEQAARAEAAQKAVAEQAARAAAAQKAVEAAQKLAQNNAANAAELAKAKQNARAAADEAARAKAQAAKAGAEADAAKKASTLAQIEADKARIAAEQARRDALAEAALAKSDAAKARDAMTKAQTEMAKARDEAAKTRAEAESDVARAQELVAKSRAEAEAAKRQAAQAMTLAERTKLEAEQARMDAAMAKSESAKAKGDAETARAEAARAKSDAEAMRAQAEQARVAAAADKRQAEAAKQSAEKLMKDAKSQLAQLEKKTRDAQDLEDKARTALAAAQAREESARETAARALEERRVAETAAKRAQDARDKSAAADRARLVAEADAAEARLAKARQATEEAESRRVAAEKAASSAKRDLDQSRTALAGVEQQRTAAVTAATEAARKRSEAEAAASDAARRRSEAEIAAADATKKQRDAEIAASEAAQRRSQAEIERARAEAQRVAAVDAARAAQAAKDAADKQRTIAEAAAKQAVAAKRDAEASVADLTAKRDAAERAAADLATRTKAEAKAQADMIAAQARKAGDDEIAAAKKEVARLAEERKRAESELSDRRKAVAQQQAESTRLATAAAQARDAAAREDARRTQLADARAKEEQELARIQAQKVVAQSQADAAAKAAALAQQKQVAAEAQAKQVTADAQTKQAAADARAKQLADAEAKAQAKQVQAQVAQTQTRSMQPVATKPGKINNVTFKGNDAAGVVEIAVAGDANIALGEVSASQVELVVDNAELAQKLERTLDVSKFGSPVKKVSSFRDRRTHNRVRLVAELSSPAIPTVVRDKGVVRWRFAANDMTKRTAVRTQNIPPTVVGGFGAASTPVTLQSVSQVPPAGAQGARGRRVYHGATVDLHFKDAPIHDLLRILSDTGNVSIVVPDTIDAKVTLDLKRVPWDQALDIILESHGLWYRRSGNIYRIDSRKILDAEDEAEAARRAAAVAAEMPRPEVVTLNYASADELRGKLEGMLSPKGKIEVDGRTNALIINDVGANREQIARLALQLDTQTPQITIEARIVEARSTFVRQFGIQWGGRALAGAAGGNATGLVFPSSIGVVGGNSDAQTPEGGITALPSDFAINLPAATGTGEGGAIGLSLGSVGGNFNINLRLSALEDTGTVRIVSAPKVTVLNNKTALIRQGVSIPISVVSAAGTQTQFVQADLKLEVTPYVSQRDCAIAMNLDVTKNEPDFVNVGARGDPTILRKEAKTTMLVNDGETTVLGGIYTRNTGLAYKKIPFFGDLPVIGWFFKNRRENDDRTEILVFITPKITNKAYLRCAQ